MANKLEFIAQFQLAANYESRRWARKSHVFTQMQKKNVTMV